MWKARGGVRCVGGGKGSEVCKSGGLVKWLV